MRRAIAVRRGSQERLRMPTTTAAMRTAGAVPRAGMPPPAASANVEAVPEIKGRPAPGVSGDEGPAPVGVVAPGAVVEGVPVRANSGGLPAFAVTGNVVVRAVVAKVGHAVGIGVIATGILGTGGGVLVVVAVALLTPGVFIFLRHPGQAGSAFGLPQDVVVGFPAANGGLGAVVERLDLTIH